MTPLSIPLGIRIVAWLAILGGVWTLLGSLAVFVFAWSMPAPPDPADAPWQVRLLYGLFRYARLVALLQVVLAAVLVWAGVGLLRLRASARAALEGLSWLGLLYVAAVGAFWWLAWTAFPDLPQPLLPARLRSVPWLPMPQFHGRLFRKPCSALPAPRCARVRGPCLRRGCASWRHRHARPR